MNESEPERIVSVMLPVEIKTTEKHVPQGNNNSGEIIVPKYLEGVVPRIFKKNKGRTRPVVAKLKTNAKVWKHSLDLSGYKPEEIQVNCSGGNTVSVTAEKQSDARCRGVQVRRTVFVPGGVDMCNISSFVSDDGKLVIQAPYHKVSPGDTCKRCCLKRKLTEESEKSQGNNHAKKLRTEVIDITNGTDSRSDSESDDAEADLRHTMGVKSNPLSPVSGTPRRMGGANVGWTTEVGKTDPDAKNEFSVHDLSCPAKNVPRDAIESHHPHSAKIPTDQESKTSHPTSNNSSLKISPDLPNNTAKSTTPPPKVLGISAGSDISYRDIGRLPSVRRQSVALSIPIENFFPDRDSIVISLQGNTLTIKANRVSKVKNSELSELFLKELVFPSCFDCSSIRLAKDVGGSLIVTAEKHE